VGFRDPRSGKTGSHPEIRNIVVMKKIIFAVGVLALTSAARVAPAAAQDRLIQEATDRGTGAALRVYATSSGPRIEMQTPALLLQKQVMKDRVVTTLKGRGDTLVIELAPASVSVASNTQQVVADATDRAQLERARQLVAKSSLAARAADLIGRIGFGSHSAIEPLLLTTRAFLMAARHDDRGARELSTWMRNLKQPQVVRAALEQRTPTDCWKAYGDEILDAYLDYVECVKNLHWYDPFGEKGCAVVYEVRILGAFTWYTGCVSLGSIIK
jgi:hypothetical protein